MKNSSRISPTRSSVRTWILGLAVVLATGLAPVDEDVPELVQPPVQMVR